MSSTQLLQMPPKKLHHFHSAPSSRCDKNFYNSDFPGHYYRNTSSTSSPSSSPSSSSSTSSSPQRLYSHSPAGSPEAHQISSIPATTSPTSRAQRLISYRPNYSTQNNKMYNNTNINNISSLNGSREWTDSNNETSCREYSQLSGNSSPPYSDNIMNHEENSSHFEKCDVDFVYNASTNRKPPRSHSTAIQQRPSFSQNPDSNSIHESFAPQPQDEMRRQSLKRRREESESNSRKIQFNDCRIPNKFDASYEHEALNFSTTSSSNTNYYNEMYDNDNNKKFNCQYNDNDDDNDSEGCDANQSENPSTVKNQNSNSKPVIKKIKHTSPETPSSPVTENNKIKTSCKNKNNKNTSANNNNNNSTTAARTPFLPPCKICGAKASGFHYGVNSCEACKGFFRRVLKRPVVFFCTKNNSCNLKRNKRSSCRFCRYKRCLSLGMSKEAIKTGRYSHQKRTQDIMAVKYLQTYNENENDYFEMDEILEKLLVSHQSHIVTSAGFQDSFLYKKQKDYHKMFLAHKKILSDTLNNLKNKHGLVNPASDNDVLENTRLNETPASSPPPSPPSPPSSCAYSNTSSGLTSDPSTNSGQQSSRLERILLSIPPSNSNTSSGQMSPGKSVSPAASSSSFDSGFSDYCGPSYEASSTLRSTSQQDSSIFYSKDNSSISDSPPHNHNIRSKFLSPPPASSSPPPTSSSSSPPLPSSPSPPRPSSQNSSTSHLHSVEYLDDCDTEILEEILKEFKQPHSFSPTTGNVTSADQNTDKNNDLETSGLDLRVRNVIHRDENNTKTRESPHHQTADDDFKINVQQTSVKLTDGYPLLRNTLQSNVHSGKSAGEYSAVIKTEIVEDTDQPFSCTTSDIDTNRNDLGRSGSSNGSRSNSSGGSSSNSNSSGGGSSNSNSSGSSSGKHRVQFPDLERDRKEKDSHYLKRVGDCVNGYVNFAKNIPGFESISQKDQATLLRLAWDEIWILGAYRGFNCELDVAVMPSGVVFHSDEIEKSWGQGYARMAFDLADILKKSGVTEEMLVLLKAICIISPDRCDLQDKEKVEKAHWLLIRCLINHLDTAMPKSDNMSFPGLVSILTSLRNLSELAQAHLSQGIMDLKVDSLQRNILSEPVTPF